MPYRHYPSGRPYPGAGPNDGRSYYNRYYFGPHYARPYYARPYYAHPYYTFRPRVSIGFGIWVGYPVAFPFYVSYGYGYPYGYPYGYAYGNPYPAPYTAPYPAYGYPAAQSTSVGVVAGAATYGGVSFEITPNDAQVFVDGAYVGSVGNFSPTYQPLTLMPGPHRIEVQAPGYEPIAFEVNITAGQVIPYQGVMQPVRP
jgi:hypothetical protein